MATKFEHIRYWDTTRSDFQYPETDPNDPLFYSAIAGRPNTGICVSGGGSVSASLIAGYYAALTELGLMQNVRYISGVSGGTWGSAPYAYLPGEADNFFGNRHLPAAINVINMGEVHAGSMAYAANHADIVDKAVWYLGEAWAHQSPANRVYEEAVGAIFLNNFGIHSPSVRNADPAYFSSDAAAVADIRSRNHSLEQAPFMTLAADRPFLIMNMTIFVPDGSGSDTIIPFEVTPLYSGVKARQPQHGIDKQPIGGAFVETFGFNTTAGEVADGIATATGDMPFELCQPVGASGSALEEMLIKSNSKLLPCFPQFNYWNPHQSGKVETHQYDFGDGGCIEDTGITPLLARGVQQIAVFLTEPVYFPGQPGQVSLGDRLFGEQAFGYNQIAALFGEALIDAKASKAANALVWVTPVSTAKQVFDNTGANNFQALLTALYDAKTNGGPLMVTMQMNVIANDLFGINAAYTPQVIWSVVDTCAAWKRELGELVKLDMLRPEFTDFPEVQVFLQNVGSVIKLTAGQTNQLANLAYWMVMTNQAAFKTLLAAESAVMA